MGGAVASWLECSPPDRMGTGTFNAGGSPAMD